jgi:hypothetical protein
MKKQPFLKEQEYNYNAVLVNETNTHGSPISLHQPLPTFTSFFLVKMMIKVNFLLLMHMTLHSTINIKTDQNTATFRYYINNC